MKILTPILFFTLFFTCCLSMSGQTRLYRRIAVVTNATKRTVNDDAHYITFSNKGCYWSDSEGICMDNAFAKYVKDENGLHCYSELSGDGSIIALFFALDYSRINIQYEIGKSDVYVWERSGRTTAPLRQRNAVASNKGYVPLPVVVDQGGSTTQSPPRSNKTQCLKCGGTGLCNTCGGKGYYLRNAGDEHVVCIICNGTGKCYVCNGRGFVFN